MEWIWWHACNWEVTFRIARLYSIMWSEWPIGQRWCAIFIIISIVKWWPLPYVICSPTMPKLKSYFRITWTKLCEIIASKMPTSTGSWQIVLKPIRMISARYMEVLILMFTWTIKNAHASSTRLNAYRERQTNTSSLSWGNNTSNFANSGRTPTCKRKRRPYTMSSMVGGQHLVPHWRLAIVISMIEWPFDIFVTKSGEVLCNS